MNLYRILLFPGILWVAQYFNILCLKEIDFPYIPVLGIRLRPSMPINPTLGRGLNSYKHITYVILGPLNKKRSVALNSPPKSLGKKNAWPNENDKQIKRIHKNPIFQNTCNLHKIMLESKKTSKIHKISRYKNCYATILRILSKIHICSGNKLTNAKQTLLAFLIETESQQQVGTAVLSCR